MADHAQYHAPDYNRDPPAARFTIDTEKLSQICRRKITTLEDVLSTVCPDVDGRPLITPTHTLGLPPEQLRIIAFDNQTGTTQPDLQRFIFPGEIALSIRQRLIPSEKDWLERMKFHCHHSQVIVGIDRPPTHGVITITNPQNYHRINIDRNKQPGLFGLPWEVLLILKPRLPQHLGNDLKRHYVNNIRTWLFIVNTLTQFPKSHLYNGYDPLTVKNLAELREFGSQLLRAANLDPAAENWLKQRKNWVYCGELIHLGLNLGLHVPLNRAHLRDLFERTAVILQSRSFILKNKNNFAWNIHLQMAPETLEPLPAAAGVSPSDIPAGTDGELLVRPLTLAEGLDQMISRMVPRERAGEHLAPYQAALLCSVEAPLYRLLGLEPKTEAGLPVHPFIQLFRKTIAVCAVSYPTYRNFRTALEPLFRDLNDMQQHHTVKHFMPPHLFMIRAAEALQQPEEEHCPGWQYIGHGLHRCLLHPLKPSA